MPTLIRFAAPEVGNYFIQPPSKSHAGGYWTSGRLNGEGCAMRFPDEAEAKAFLAAHGYDLPPLKVTFQSA